MARDFFNIRLRPLQGIISTDDILPAVAKHMSTDRLALARSLFMNYRPEFGKSLQMGDVIVCTETFGIGSSREQAPQALKASGVRGILATDFGSIFFRNAWNIGLFAVRISPMYCEDKEMAAINLENGILQMEGRNQPFAPPASFFLDFLESGGILPHIAKYGTLCIDVHKSV